MIKNTLKKLQDGLVTRWISCGIVSDKKSVQYGIYFSYPIYILIVFAGILLENQFIILVDLLIAFLGIKLPLHPFDYVYNYTFAKLIGTKKIPGRGSELQVNSIVAFIFNLIVFALIISGITINFGALAIIYALVSLIFIVIFLFKD